MPLPLKSIRASYPAQTDLRLCFYSTFNNKVIENRYPIIYFAYPLLGSRFGDNKKVLFSFLISYFNIYISFNLNLTDIKPEKEFRFLSNTIMLDNKIF